MVTKIVKPPGPPADDDAVVPSPPRREPILSLQVMRTIAALGVAAYHIKILITDTGGGEFFSSLVSTGWLGVDVFFVLSGFIMWYSTNDQTDPTRFFLKRLSRIYTPLWPALALTVIFGTYTCSQHLEFGPIFRSATLFGVDPFSLYLYTTWTLAYEMLFYTAFALVLLAGRQRNAFTFVAITVLVVELSNYMQNNFGFAAPELLTTRRYYEFIMGAVVAAAVGQRLHPTWLRISSFLAGLCLIVAGVVVDGWYDRADNILFVGCGTALLIFGISAVEPYLRNRVGRGLAKTGDWSYAMYLLHPALIYAMKIGGIDWTVFTTVGPLAGLAIYLTVLTLLSAVFYRLVETPLLNLSRRLIDRLPQKPPTKKPEPVVIGASS